MGHADPLLTLCLIARDEEARLPDCLASVAGVVDEMIVVDTGSRDRTREIACEAGARVVEHVWSDDFAAARNRALEEVVQGYVLLLDADECLAPGAGPALREAVARGDFDAAELPLHNASRGDATVDEVLSGKARLSPPVHLARLFRYTDDLRWEGIVHEHVTAWAMKHRRRVRLDAPIVHYGSAQEVVEERGKNARNLGLLERRKEQDPNSPSVWRYLAQELLNARRHEEALEAVGRAWELTRQALDSGLEHVDIVGPASLRAYLLLHAGNVDEASTTLERALEGEPQHPNLHYLRGRCAETRCRLSEAEEAYRVCLALRDQVVDHDVFPGVTGHLAHTRLGTVQLLAGKVEQAQASFEEALREKPNHIEARLGRIETWVLQGRLEEALGALEPFLRPELADGWILASLAGERQSGFDAVAPLYEQALRALDSSLLVGAHRREHLRELGRRCAPRPG